MSDPVRVVVPSLLLIGFLCAEYSASDSESDEESDASANRRDDNEEAELNSKVLAHVQLARSVREFGLQSWCPGLVLILWCFRKESPYRKSRTSNQSTFPSGTYSTFFI